MSDYEQAVMTIREILWLDDGEWDDEKTWDSGTLEEIAAVLYAAGLKPPCKGGD